MTKEEVVVPFVSHQGFENVDLYRFYICHNRMRMKKRKKTQSPNDGVWWLFGPFQSCLSMIHCSSMDWFHVESLGFKSLQPACFFIFFQKITRVPSCAIMYWCKIVLSYHSWKSLRTARSPGNGCGQCSSTATALGSGSLCNEQGTEEGGRGVHSKNRRKSSDISIYWNYFFKGHSSVRIYMLIHLIDPKFAYWHGKVQFKDIYTSSSPTSRASDEIDPWYVVQKWWTSVSSPWV